MNTPIQEPAKPKDWEPWDVKRKLASLGLTLSDVARAAGLADRTPLSKALLYPSPINEARLAAAMNMNPADIWPSRYDADGKPAPQRAPLENNLTLPAHLCNVNPRNRRKRHAQPEGGEKDRQAA